MKIAIDCRSLRKKPAGVANFLIGVINHMAILQKEWKIYLLSNEDFSDEIKMKLSSSANIIKVIEPLPFLSKIATIWYLLKVASILKKLNIDLFYCPIPNLPFFIPANVRTLITIHDMVYRHFPETMSIGNRMINFCLHDYSINTADRLWAVSHYTKSEIETMYPRRKCKKIEVGTSIDKSIFHPRKLAVAETNAVLKKYNIQRKFILTVGTLEPRKNLQFLLSLMPALAAENLELVIVGNKGWGNTSLNLPDLDDVTRNKIRFAGFVPDEDLIKLYHLASVYVCTSLNEGFCLPLLEAMQCGCPVVTAHNSGMIEVAEGAGETVSGWDKDVWIDVIKQTIANRSKCVESGFKKAQAYEWSEVVGRIISFVNEG
jgi:glycosyltransferase involved in cell wall biosynthesis